MSHVFFYLVPDDEVGIDGYGNREQRLDIPCFGIGEYHMQIFDRTRAVEKQVAGNNPDHTQCSIPIDNNNIDDQLKSHAFYRGGFSHRCGGNLPHPMNHFNRIRSQIVGGYNRGILRERETWKKSIYDRQTFEYEFSRPAVIDFRIHVDRNTGVVVALISAAIYDSSMRSSFCFRINSRHNARVCWSNYDENQVHRQDASAQKSTKEIFSALKSARNASRKNQKLQKHSDDQCPEEILSQR